MSEFNHDPNYEPIQHQQSYSYECSGGPQPSASQQAPQPEPAPQKKSGKAGKVVALLLACALVGGGSGWGAAALAQKNSGSAAAAPTAASSDASVMLESQRQATALQVASVDTGKELTAAEVYAQNVNSTVGITTSITTNYFGYQTTAAAAGSGFILTQDGYILTNYHVIESSDSIKVTTYDGTSYDAQLIGYDESNDIAVLKIDASDLAPVVLGDSDTVNVGDSVVAIGNPLGELTFSLTAGAISALDRPVTLSSGTTMNLMQTDCAINSGNSGGALFNMYGQVIGITNMKMMSAYSSIEGIGFAIPSATIGSVVDSLIKYGEVIGRPSVGITVGAIPDVAREEYGLPEGLYVSAVAENSDAARQGMKVGDVITEVNYQRVTTTDEINAIKNTLEVGDVMVFTVWRDGETLEFEVMLMDTNTIYN